MRQALGPGALGKPRGSGWRGRWEGVSWWGTHVNPWLFHSNVWQNSLQIKKKKKKKYSFYRLTAHGLHNTPPASGNVSILFIPWNPAQRPPPTEALLLSPNSSALTALWSPVGTPSLMTCARVVCVLMSSSPLCVLYSCLHHYVGVNSPSRKTPSDWMFTAFHTCVSRALKGPELHNHPLPRSVLPT